MKRTNHGLNLTELADRIGLAGPSMLDKVLRGRRRLTVANAVDLELASEGALKFEDLVQPETVQALQKLWRWRWKNGHLENGGTP